jgi:hypothetical protein
VRSSRLGLRGTAIALLAALFALAHPGLPAHAAGTTYYVSPDGNDRATGTSPGTAWKTLAKVSAVKLLPGDQVLLQGGAAFPGLLWITPDDAGVATNPLTVGSYGSGRATISAGNGVGIYIQDTSGVAISGVNVDGSGRTTNTASGIYARNARAGDVLLRGLELTDVDVGGFGKWGVLISGENGRSGFSDVRMLRVVAHDNGIGGILAHSALNAVHRRVEVVSSRAYANPGVAGLLKNSGNGIVFGSVDQGTIQRSVATANGGLNDSNEGGAGIWAYNSNRVTIQFNESYANRTGGTVDGGGFDLDENVTNSVIQYNYSHNNDGAGYLLAQRYATLAHHDNVVRYNVGENDGRKNGGSGIRVWGAVRDAEIYGNTIFMTRPPTGASEAFSLANNSSGTFVNGVHLRNNIFSVKGVAMVSATARALSGAVDLRFQGNDYFAGSAKPKLIWGATTYFGLPAWRSGTGQERLNGADTGLSVDPGLASPGNGGTIDGTGPLSSLTAYKLRSNSPLINRALDLTGLFGINMGGRDFYGGSVPMGAAPDIGAHEAG